MPTVKTIDGDVLTADLVYYNDVWVFLLNNVITTEERIIGPWWWRKKKTFVCDCPKMVRLINKDEVDSVLFV